MKKNCITKILSLTLSLSLCFSLPVLPSRPAKAVSSGATILETDVTTASTGCTLVGLRGSYYSQAQTALDKINEIRKEACEAGNVPDPRDPSRMLTPNDYNPLKWSSDLENIARIRAAEAGISYAFMDSGHDRPSDKHTLSIISNGVFSNCEDLAYYHITEMTEGILLWYSEKKDWLSQSSENEVGHYTSMIDPQYNYVGLGDFYCTAAKYHNTLAGEFSKETNLDETMQNAPENVIQKIEVSNNYIQNRYLDGDTSLNTEESKTYTPKIRLKRNRAVRDVWSVEDITFISSNPSIASISEDGTVTAHKKGTVSITAYAGDSLFASLDLTIHCTHERTLVSYTPATCTKTGLKTYYCQICDDTTEKVLDKTPHDYVYTEPDSSGKATGVCSVCKDTITIVPPSKFEVTWQNTAFSYRGYSKKFPIENPVGSSLYCWPQLGGGDQNYSDLILTSTNESVVSVPDSIAVNGPINKLLIAGNGITQLSIYPKYNKRLIKTFTVRIGEKHSIDIKKAGITLSQNTYTYDGTEKKPELTVSYKETPLTEGCDYAVSYENNLAAGTACVIIRGKGLFYGTQKETFLITPKEVGSHTHKAVIDEAIPSTCTATGMTEGSHCSLCGETITAPKETDATEHSYVNGTCKNCGDVTYLDKDSLRFSRIENLDGSYSISVSAIPDTTITGSIEIPENISFNGTDYPVSGIAENAFAGQTNLTNIIIPDTVELIGSGAFKNCTGLTEMKFYETTAPVIEENVWQGANTSLSLLAPKNSIGYYELASQSGGSVSYQNLHKHNLIYHKAVAPSCESSGNVEYYYCSKCEHYFLDKNAEKGCYLLDTMLFPLGHDWESEYTIDIPATKEKDGERSLHCKRCNARTAIHSYRLVTETATDGDSSSHFDYEDYGTNSSYTKSNNAAKIYPKTGKVFRTGGLKYKITAVSPAKKKFTATCIGSTSKKRKNLIVPNTVIYKNTVYQVTGIGKSAFAKYKKLKTVSLPSSIKNIGIRAFYKCRSLKSIAIFSSHLTKRSIGKQAFVGIHKKSHVFVLSKKRKAYKKWFQSKGLRL